MLCFPEKWKQLGAKQALSTKLENKKASASPASAQSRFLSHAGTEGAETTERAETPTRQKQAPEVGRGSEASRNLFREA